MTRGITVENVHVTYGSIRAVRGVSLAVAGGECLAVMGANGAGKSSLFRAISRLVPYEGTIKLGDEVISGRPEDVVRRGIAHVQEGRQIFTQMTVRENMQVAEYATGKSVWRERYEGVLDLFPLLKPLLSRPAGRLSGGQQQALALARGLLTAPDVLLLDEPSLGLAPIVVDQLAESVRHVREHWSTTVLLSEQNIHLCVAVADRVCIISRGQVVHEGLPNSDVLFDEALRGYLG